MASFKYLSKAIGDIAKLDIFSMPEKNVECSTLAGKPDVFCCYFCGIYVDLYVKKWKCQLLRIHFFLSEKTTNNW